jgi:TrmH family RNA methyltransferase
MPQSRSRSRLRVVLVEPRYELNIGYVARAMENFACSDLWIVKPSAKEPKGRVAKMFSKKGSAVLDKAKVTDSFQKALKGTTLVVGTTGAPARFGKRILKNCITPKDLVDKVASEDKIALVFGSEDRGLGAEELDACDVVVSIPANPRYPVLNISHAVAILLYETAAAGKKTFYPIAKKKDVESLEKMFREMVAGLPSVRDKRKVALAFERILDRARPAENEVNALFAALSPLAKPARATK